MHKELLTFASLSLLLTMSPVTLGQSAADSDSPVVEDIAFETLVDMNVLSDALSRRDAGQLTEVALLILSAEEILLRKHYSGEITAEKVLMAAAEAAGQNKEALARLNGIANNLGDRGTFLIAQIEIAQKLPGKTRGESPKVELSASVEEFARRKRERDARDYPETAAMRNLLATRGGGGWALGVDLGDYIPGQGVEVTDVYSRSAASGIFNLGDRITEVNGYAVRSKSDLIDRVRNAAERNSGRVNMTVVDNRSGRSRERRMQLSQGRHSSGPGIGQRPPAGQRKGRPVRSGGSVSWKYADPATAADFRGTYSDLQVSDQEIEDALMAVYWDKGNGFHSLNEAMASPMLFKLMKLHVLENRGH